MAQQDPAALASMKIEPEPVPAASTIARSHQRKDSASILGRPSIDTTNPVVDSDNFPINAISPSPEKTGANSASSTPVPEKVEAPYPTTFAHIVELITTGQPIPGIRDIPNVLNTAPPSEATKAKRRKPWEITADSPGKNAEKKGIASSAGSVGP